MNIAKNKPLSLLSSYIGAIPYIGVALSCLYIKDTEIQIRLSQMLIAYSVMVISFLSGIHWHHAQSGHKTTSALALIPALCIFLCFGAALFFSPVWPLFVTAALFLFLRKGEITAEDKSFLPQKFIRLRLVLALISFTSLMICALRLKGTL